MANPCRFYLRRDNSKAACFFEKRQTRTLFVLWLVERRHRCPFMADHQNNNPCLRRYLFKLYATPEQAERLNDEVRMMGELYNAIIQRIEDTRRRTRGQPHVVHAEGKSQLSYFDITAEITGLRHECPEWAGIPAMTAHRTAKWVTDSFAAFYRRLTELKNPAVYQARSELFIQRRGRKPTSFELAGYPNYRKIAKATTIGLGTHAKAGWQLEQRPDNPLSWRLHMKGITPLTDRSKWLHVRGVLPDGIIEFRNADIIKRDGGWWLSLCVAIECRRLQNGNEHINIMFDLIDEFAIVNGIAETPEGLREAQIVEADIDALKARRDTDFPRGRRRSETEQAELRELNRDIGKLYTRLRRLRSNALHVWTARIVARANKITIQAPDLSRLVRTGRGNEKQWGAAVDTAAAVNRNTLALSPSSAISMLRYKAEEAGIACEVQEDCEPAIKVGREIVETGKIVRKARKRISGNSHHSEVSVYV